MSIELGDGVFDFIVWDIGNTGYTYASELTHGGLTGFLARLYDNAVFEG